jgi:hypothetical protein
MDKSSSFGIVEASKLGDALRHPFFIGKNQVIKAWSVSCF